MQSSCFFPWFDMDFRWGRLAQWCCYYAGPLVDLKAGRPIDLPAIWNGPQFQGIRALLASGHLEGSGCEPCVFFKHSMTTAPYASRSFMPDCLNARQRANWERAIENYEARSLVVDSLPVRYILEFGAVCNLDCIMCTQQYSIRRNRRGDRSSLEVDSLMQQKEALQLANEFIITGGEPFMEHNARRFIDFLISDPAFHHAQLCFTTNGTLIHRYLERFRPFRRVHMSISIDAIGPAYEYIRRGARWSKTERNILNFREEGARLGLNWAVNINCVMMKTSIEHMLELVSWCITHDVGPRFTPLRGMPFTHEEDVFAYPGLLRDIPGWEFQFEASLDLLERKGWPWACTPLQSIYAELKELSNDPVRASYFPVPASPSDPSPSQEPPPPEPTPSPELHLGHQLVAQGARFHAVPATLSPDEQFARLEQAKPGVLSARSLPSLRHLLERRLHLESLQRAGTWPDAARAPQAGDPPLPTRPLEGSRALLDESILSQDMLRLLSGLKIDDFTLLSSQVDRGSSIFHTIALESDPIALAERLNREQIELVVLPFQLQKGLSGLEGLLDRFNGRLLLVFSEGTCRLYEQKDLPALRRAIDTLRRASRFLPTLKGLRVLEVGCGGGLASELLAHEGPESVLGVDLCLAPGSACRTRHVSFLQTDAASLGLEAGTFDVCLSTSTLEHCSDPYAVLSELRRVTRPGGTCYVQAGPLYYSAEGHHLGEYLRPFPWIHLSLSHEALIGLLETTGIAAHILKKEGLSAEDFVLAGLSPARLNGLTFQDYGLERFVNLPDVEVLQFARTHEKKGPLAGALARSLPAVPKEEFLIGGFELVFQMERP